MAQQTCKSFLGIQALEKCPTAKSMPHSTIYRGSAGWQGGGDGIIQDSEEPGSAAVGLETQLAPLAQETQLAYDLIIQHDSPIAAAAPENLSGQVSGLENHGAHCVNKGSPGLGVSRGKQFNTHNSTHSRRGDVRELHALITSCAPPSL